MVEQRVIGQKIGARRPASSPAPAPEEPLAPPATEETPPKRRRRTRPIVVALVVAALAVAGVAAYLLLTARAAEAQPQSAPAPVPGNVLTVETVSVNLAGGHYLRLGMALQLTADVAREPDPSRALDLAIAWYSGRPITEVTDPASRTQLKAGLLQQIEAAYEGEVMDLYLTDYVTQ